MSKVCADCNSLTDLPKLEVVSLNETSVGIAINDLDVSQPLDFEKIRFDNVSPLKHNDGLKPYISSNKEVGFFPLKRIAFERLSLNTSHCFSIESNSMVEEIELFDSCQQVSSMLFKDLPSLKSIHFKRSVASGSVDIKMNYINNILNQPNPHELIPLKSLDLISLPTLVSLQLDGNCCSEFSHLHLTGF